VITDNSNFLVRCWFEGGIPDVHNLAHQLAERPGIVEHGLFLDMAQQVIVAGEHGVRIIDKKLDTGR
jgi:ribose 5-phosphate isomerase A